MNKKILVTGSSGYIGRHLCHLLKVSGYEVYGLDVVEKPTMLDNFKLLNINGLMYYPDEFDAVVHLAALVNVGVGQKAPMDYYRTNIVGTMNVLQHFFYKNFIFASTCQAKADNVYGKSKLIGENIVTQYCQLTGRDKTIFRFGNVIGSHGYEPTNLDGLMYNLMKAKETGTFYLLGDDYNTRDGTAIRDYLHVMEVCQAIMFAIERPTPDSIVENLGHGTGFTVMEMVNAFKEANNCDFNIEVKPRREGDPESVVLTDISAYMQPRYNIVEMMKV